MDKGITSKYIKEILCEKCDVKCCKRGNHNIHITKQKHERITMDNGITSITSDKPCDKLRWGEIRLFRNQ